MNTAEVPLHVCRELQAYIHRRKSPGPFLLNVLANDLLGAFANGTPDEIACLPELTADLLAAVDHNIWGSAFNVEAYLNEDIDVGVVMDED